MKYFFSLLSLVAAVPLSWAQGNSPFELVNSPYDEQQPVISPDGKTLYFTVANHPQNLGGKKDPGDIWLSLWLAGSWSAPVHAGTVLNNKGYNAVAGFSADGTEMFLLSHYAANGDGAATQGIARSRNTGSGWSAPENISIPYFLNRSVALSGDFTRDHNVFVFSAESYSTVGAEDIYVSLRQDGKWKEPVNLGLKINTPFQEMSPSLSMDGTKLYFASNGRRGGLGSFDIYVSERLDESWTNWSVPANLGQQVNSADRELYYREEQPGYFLYTSTRNSDGYGDIRFLKDSLQKPPVIDTLTKLVENDRSVIGDKEVRISGRVTNSKTGESIPARIVFKSDSVYTTASSKSGAYVILVPSTRIYSIEVDAKGYVNISEKLDIHTFQMQALEMNFKLQPIEVGTLVSLKSVLFDQGTTDLLSESYEELNVVVDFLNSNPKVEIELEGHTDNRGDAKKNQVLSLQRVEKIKEYLVKKGISGKRIKGKGFGGTRPIATNDSEEARKLNRRVEFMILKN